MLRLTFLGATGTVIIPSFAVGRAQTVLHYLLVACRWPGGAGRLANP